VKSDILDQNKFFPCLILTDGRQKLAVIVDLVIGEYEGVLKPFGPQLKHVNNFSGAMLMGDGQVVPVLNPSEIVLSASVKSKQLSESFSHESTAEDTSERNILVAEDSITVRNMLRNILENAGFNVKTAVDGQQAFEFLSENTFDLVVSDVEMPRMNGFELTRNIKAHPDYSSLPVILVTALESTEDRQKGMEAGANAYIVKGSFEKSNLIETINRLI
jgi:two-component system chemotaxis sensor kinase CheA